MPLTELNKLDIIKESMLQSERFDSLKASMSVRSGALTDRSGKGGGFNTLKKSRSKPHLRNLKLNIPGEMLASHGS